MILITDGFHSWDTANMFAKFDEIKAAGVRIIALGFFGQFAFYSPNLFLMTNEVYHVSTARSLIITNSFLLIFWTLIQLTILGCKLRGAVGAWRYDFRNNLRRWSHSRARFTVKFTRATVIGGRDTIGHCLVASSSRLVRDELGISNMASISMEPNRTGRSVTNISQLSLVHSAWRKRIDVFVIYNTFSTWWISLHVLSD